MATDSVDAPQENKNGGQTPKCQCTEGSDTPVKQEKEEQQSQEGTEGIEKGEESQDQAQGEEEVEAEEEEPKTSKFYETFGIPDRFERPLSWRCYNVKRQHPLYTTTTSDYGSRKPTFHEMPLRWHGVSQRFSQARLKSGMYRNFSLNTAKDEY
eukprot:Nk52_evm1s547 gene=Nk52_evmTU1s547